MTEIKLRRLTVDRSENIVRYYVRVPGKPKVRIFGEPGSAEFMAAYRAAVAGDKPAPIDRPKLTTFAPRTFGRAVLDYYTSGKYEALGKAVSDPAA